ncbi:DNA adenine methylase [Geminocystis herdmanii]|uniref:DNA adenine methylase n=1 Tax=Geminocystis herdmanii TaxID=669359 RepID=UPI00034B2465|nr:Dam family site-specific DNA-(adenine-N6)-methyltransferase [Geminocystis herdmanii]
MTEKIIIPPIKCQGIKTKLVLWIKAIIPDNFNGYWIEPFMGSGVVAFNIMPKKAILADSNPHLINFYKAIQEEKINASIVKIFLENEGKILEKTQGEYYYTVRQRFNEKLNPLDFLFLNRACFNGMIRFNNKGYFNVPFCKKPQRFSKAYITKICNQVQALFSLLKMGNYEFICQDFSDTIAMAKDKDLIYCDPPYIDRYNDYYNGWQEKDEYKLSELLKSVKTNFIMSTWHSNHYRENNYLSLIWSDYYCLTRQHFYHLGGKEINRNPMLEALITNFQTNYIEIHSSKSEQLSIF